MQRFYGGRPADWLEIPQWLLAAYEQARPMLIAEEALARISQVAVGTGTMSEEDQRSYMGELRRASTPRHVRRAVKATSGMLSQLGIPVTTIPAPAGG